MAMLESITYVISRSLYVSLTNRCNAVSLLESRGPGFVLPPTFSRLPSGFEPSAEQVASEVARVLADGAQPTEVVFAGAGEPLLKLRALEGAAGLIREQSAIPMRLNTNGLVPKSEVVDTVRQLKDAGLSGVTVALATADPQQYIELMKPEPIRLSPVFSIPLGHAEVCSFVSVCAAAGLKVECTAVAAPGVQIEATEALAHNLGANSFRSRTFHPAMA